NPSPSGKPAGDTGASEDPSEPVDRRAHSRRCQRPQRQSCQARDATNGRESRARSLEAMAVLHARGTDGLATAAPEAAIEMVGERGVVGGQVAALEGAHQLDAAAW